MSEVRPILGVCYILVGDPTEEDGAGMEYAGETRGDVEVPLEVLVAYARSDQSGPVPLASSGYAGGIRPLANVPLYPASKSILNKFLPGSQLMSTTGENPKTALAFGSPGRIPEEDVPTMVLVPVDEAAFGVDAPNAIWFPAMGVIDGGSFVFNLPEGDDAGNPMSFQFGSQLRKVDQGGTAIAKKARCGWQGPPEAVGLTDWTLPDLTDL